MKPSINLRQPVFWLLPAILVGLLFVVVGSQADTEMYSVTASDKAFFEQIRKAILTDDAEWFSGAVSYPIELHLKKGTLHLARKADLKKHASLIFDERLKSLVRNQSASSLFKNWQGVMIGDGELWFSEVGAKTGQEGGLAWEYRITALNFDTQINAPKK